MNLDTTSSTVAQTPKAYLESLTWLDDFVHTYQMLGVDNLACLQDIYHPDVTFIDPMHELQGFGNLHTYFVNLYSNLTSCHFHVDEVVAQKEHAALYWTMTYQHKTLNGGNTVSVKGSSLIKAQDNKVIYHRDYVDLGAMLYEQLPVIGRLIRWIKKRAAK